MTRLDFVTYLSHLRADSRRFRDVVADCDPAAPVPACPDRNAADLLWHLAEVQAFWGRVIAERPAGPNETWQPPSRPPDVPGLLARFDECSERLTDSLEEAAPSGTAWSWAPEQTVGFTFRRQAHEALIHRLDAEQTAGCTTPLDPDLAADGVAELMEVMYGGTPPTWSRFTPEGGLVALHLVDVDVRIKVQPGHLDGVDPADGTDVTGPHLVRVETTEDADTTIAGTAGDLDTWLWRRGDDRRIRVTGDPAARARFRAAVDQPLD
ncbi:maleylpyruvate isomerase family mycothiol-dependent enzyme [Nocardioides panacisoli]|uniref:maleylpyruvate isomerase family mycothiol-dependent enzyme n=1 Tax=Nocardioides panacisoli TaxID=627624 RepID=UPI001C637743|nr:maleylpyruvate isomerase family mycothiol-dependent enzyme [Nocardioides panacisoli]QYJ05161.1 maleylpyruvate isomerase family mycothiol-dependent enzyme [Nocardioides panacisoli]